MNGYTWRNEIESKLRLYGEEYKTDVEYCNLTDTQLNDSFIMVRHSLLLYTKNSVYVTIFHNGDHDWIIEHITRNPPKKNKYIVKCSIRIEDEFLNSKKNINITNSERLEFEKALMYHDYVGLCVVDELEKEVGDENLDVCLSSDGIYATIVRCGAEIIDNALFEDSVYYNIIGKYGEEMKENHIAFFVETKLV